MDSSMGTDNIGGVNMALDTLEIFGDEFTNVTGIKATNNNNQTKTYIRPQGTKSITNNGTNIDVASYATANVSVTNPTQHTIHLEFSDETDTDITVYYNDSFFGSAITAYEPTTWTYNNKTVYVAQLDNITWYDATPSAETWETVYDGNLDFYQENNGDYPYCWITGLGDTYPITLGSVWRVTYSGVQYRLICSIMDGNSGVIGNPKYYMSTDDGSNVPFYFISPFYGAWSGAIDIPNENTRVYIKIEKLITS